MTNGQWSIANWKSFALQSNCHCERSEAILRDCHVAHAPRNDHYQSFEGNYFMLPLLTLHFVIFIFQFILSSL